MFKRLLFRTEFGCVIQLGRAQGHWAGVTWCKRGGEINWKTAEEAAMFTKFDSCSVYLWRGCPEPLPGRRKMPARSCFSGRSFPLGWREASRRVTRCRQTLGSAAGEDVPLAEVCPLAAPVGPRWRRPAGSSRVPGRRGGGSPAPAPTRGRHVGPPGKQAAQQPAPAPEPHQAGPQFLHRRGMEPGGGGGGPFAKR